MPAVVGLGAVAVIVAAGRAELTVIPALVPVTEPDVAATVREPAVFSV